LYVDTLRDYGEICLLTDWTLKAGGHFKADGVFLIEKGALMAKVHGMVVVDGMAH